MKAILILAAILALASCNYIPVYATNDCNSARCPSNVWNFNRTNYNLTCPQSGYNTVRFNQLNEKGIYLELANTTSPYGAPTVLPLTYLPYSDSNRGVQYYTTLSNNTYFALVNCSLPGAQNLTRLCQSNQLVGGKFVNNSQSFSADCGFGLNFINYGYEF